MSFCLYMAAIRSISACFYFSFDLHLVFKGFKSLALLLALRFKCLLAFFLLLDFSLYLLFSFPLLSDG